MKLRSRKRTIALLRECVEAMQAPTARLDLLLKRSQELIDHLVTLPYSPYSARRSTHAYSRTRAYRVWQAMRQRCENPKNTEFRHYGGRGIKVCERWSTFENFLNDMGSPPIGLTLDRRDNDGHYELSNCRWATRAQQNQNQRRTKLTTGIVQEIRGRFEHGESRASIKTRFPTISSSSISSIINERYWRD